MDGIVTWLIVALFYAPLHYLLPVLVVLIRSSEVERRRALIHTLIDCTVSMGLSFALVIWLVTAEQVTAAMAVLLCSLAAPYVRILSAKRWKAGDTATPD